MSVWTAFPSCPSPSSGPQLYRKHVITEQPYIAQLVSQMEAEGVIPLPIFINGVEAHTVVGGMWRVWNV